MIHRFPIVATHTTPIGHPLRIRLSQVNILPQAVVIQKKHPTRSFGAPDTLPREDYLRGVSNSIERTNIKKPILL